jgi:hypothetical protein
VKEGAGGGKGEAKARNETSPSTKKKKRDKNNTAIRDLCLNLLEHAMSFPPILC